MSSMYGDGNFPDPTASAAEKDTKEYILGYGKAISHEWWFATTGDQNRNQYQTKLDNFDRLRLYARGEHNTSLSEQVLVNQGTGAENNVTYTNLDWRPIKVLPKFLRKGINALDKRLYRVRAEATDKHSTDLKDFTKKNLEDLMASRETLMQAKELLGVDLMGGTPASIPDDQEEIDLYMNLQYKPSIEIATEEAIEYTFELNNFNRIKRKWLEDLFTLGITGVEHYTDPHKGIMLKYADPADMVYSFPEDNDFSGVYYYGKVRRIPISELKRIADGQISDEDIKNSAIGSGEWATSHGYSNTRAFRPEDFEGYMIDVLDFCYKTTIVRTHKKKYSRNGKGYKMKEMPDTFEKKDPAYKGYDVVRKPIEVWYKGSLVLGTDLIYNYGKCENMVREKGYLNRTLPPFLMFAPEMYQGRADSAVNQAIQYVDQLQQVAIKIQQFVAKARPNGIYIDVNGLDEIALDDGGTVLTPLELMKIYDETGNVFGTSETDEGNYNHGRMPIQELRNGIIEGIDRLIGVYNHNLQELRAVLGIPQGSDATLPHPDTLVGVQNEAARSSDETMSTILYAAQQLTESLAGGVALRLRDIFDYSDLRSAYMNAIGKRNVDILKSIEQYSLHDLGIFIELKPDTEERQYLEANIAAGLQAQDIGIDDAIDVREIDNIKLANQVIKMRKRKRDQDKRAHELQLEETRNRSNIEAAQLSAQAKIQEIQAKAEADSAGRQEQGEVDRLKIQAEKEAKAELMAQEFQYNMALNGIQVDADMLKKDRDEASKMRLQDRAKEQDSMIAAEKAKDRPKPLRFESKEDGISGSMDMEDIGPK